MLGRLRRQPWLTVVIVFHNMQREARRTLYSLSPAYQEGVVEGDYRVIALDHGSDVPIEYPQQDQAPPALDYRFVHTTAVSPVVAVNEAVRSARTEHVMINIDGARILSPGLLALTRKATRCFDDPFVYTLGWHLGPDVQNRSMEKGYTRAREDALLSRIDWKRNGYRLFEISALAGSSCRGFLNLVSESNCFTIRRRTWLRLGGFDPGFRESGGGLVNLDFFQRACRLDGVEPVCLLGEGTFHQLHGGVATNVPRRDHPMPRFQEEYRRIRGNNWQLDESVRPVFLGRLPDAARPFVQP